VFGNPDFEAVLNGLLGDIPEAGAAPPNPLGAPEEASELAAPPGCEYVLYGPTEYPLAAAAAPGGAKATFAIPFGGV
jgi:hypothetical protein